MTAPRPAAVTPRRRLTAVAAALVVAAAALQGAAGLRWAGAAVDAVGRGRVTVAATGADLVPGLTAVALLALAAVAAAVALGGFARRALGAALAAVGLWLTGTVVGLLLAPPTAEDLAALPGAPTGAAPVPGSAAPAVGVAVGLLGALTLLAAGTVLLVARDLPRLGDRHRRRSAPAGRSGAPTPDGPAGPASEAVDPDRATWDALDAGRDPTAGPVPRPARPGRTDGGGSSDTA